VWRSYSGGYTESGLGGWGVGVMAVDRVIMRSDYSLFCLDTSGYVTAEESRVVSDYTGQQRFWPMRKSVSFWCIFGRWIRICFQNFSITHTFRLNFVVQCYQNSAGTHQSHLQSRHDETIYGKLYLSISVIKIFYYTLFLQSATHQCTLKCTYSFHRKENFSQRNTKLVRRVNDFNLPYHTTP
jgi:hypothetical protein